MLAMDGTVGASDGAFDVSEGGIHPLERGRQGSAAARLGDDRLMDAAGFADTGETAQPVRDSAGGIEIVPRQGGDLGAARRHDRRLARRTAAAFATVALAAEIGVVHLDPSRQTLCGVPLHHHLHQFVLDFPGRGLGDPKPASQLDAGNASLALGEVVHGAKPSPQRHFGRRENCSGDQGCLPSTGGTLVKRAGFDEAVMLAAADWADETRGPAPTHHCLAALILGSVQTGKLSLTEALLKLDLVARIVLTRLKQPYVPGLYHDFSAEDSR